MIYLIAIYQVSSQPCQNRADNGLVKPLKTIEKKNTAALIVSLGSTCILIASVQEVALRFKVFSVLFT